MTYQQWLRHATNELKPPSSTPRLDAEVLLALATNKTRAHLLAYPETELKPKEVVLLAKLLERRASGEPIAYITGFAEFYGHRFAVTPATLIPRPESESFIELLHELRAEQRIHTLIDIGTGSGALAITVKLHHPDMYITATDTSKKALAVAAKNSLAHFAPITLRQQSLLTGDKEGYDVVFANLPYVPTGTPPHASIAHEPPEALFSGPDGLGHYRRLFTQLEPKHIRFVLVESLKSQHAAITQLAHQAGYTLKKTGGLVQFFTKNEH